MAPSSRTPDLHAVLEKLLAVRHIASQITHIEHLPARAACLADFPAQLDPRLRTALRARGIHHLYSHQAQVFELAMSGHHVVVVTPTASGKTLCFNLPVLQRLLENPKDCALYLYPTKALAQDQYLELNELVEATQAPMRLFTFDGDTPANARKAIRSAGNIILTNPDMLHTGILPNHTGWSRIFEHLRFVIIDEIHHYRGVFGSHVANVIRRLSRICEFYGSAPQFICCSATIANPLEIAQRLTEREFALVDRSGAPSGEKYFLFYNPPLVNEQLGIRRNVVNEARRLATRLLADGIQTIIFARSRMRVELLVNYLRKTLRRLRQKPERIAGYRGGYLPNERRLIERGVKNGDILGIVSTNALELGIDIGQLRAAILAGYPGSVASTWQQAGRAGRKAESSLAILVASSLPLDQYVVTHPLYFFGKPPEAAMVNPNNPAILINHLKCAAFELPFADGERFGGIDPAPLLQLLENEQVLRHTADKWFWCADIYPSENISLRSASAENFVVVDVANKNRVLAEIDYDSAPFLIHSEAIYMHMGEVYYIDRLDWDRRTAFARPHRSEYYTEALAKTDIHIIHEDVREEIATRTWHDVAGESAPPALPEVAARTQEYPLVLSSTEGVPASSDIPDVAHEKLRVEFESQDQPLTDKPSLPTPDSVPGLLSRSFGNVAVVTIVAKYKKLRFETHENIGYGEVHVPPLEMQTEAAWFTFRPELLPRFETAMLSADSGLKGVAHLFANVIPLYVLCDPTDVGVVPVLRDPHTGVPTLYVYDKYPGGTGLARKVFDVYVPIFRAAYDVLVGCACAAGCPSCVGPVLETGQEAKRTARLWLESALNLVPGAPPSREEP